MNEQVGLRNTSTGDTISSTPSGRPSSNIRLPSMEVPPAVCSVALETESPSSQRTLDEFLARQLAEDPSLRLTTDAATGETLMSGVGELHLEAVTDRIAAEVDAEVRASRPRVAYRESVGKSARHVEHYDARIGSAHLVASLRVAVEPREEGGVTVAGDGWSREQATAIREGVSAALGRGVLCGLPTRGVAAVVDRPPDAPDASDAGLVALRACAAAATQKAMQAASPRVLEPMMRVEVVVPESFGGDIAAALSHPARCRGIVDDVSPARHAGFVCIQATAPLAGMMGFATQMRSVCKGRGDVSMVFNGYAPVPTSVADRLRDGLQH